VARGSSKRSQVVPEAHKALDAMKYEIAAELGLPVGANRYGLSDADTEFAGELGAMSSGSSSKEDYWGHVASRDAGAVGGHITRRLIQQAQQSLLNLSGE
jgi:small acid-soluble spore protein B (major beta-type SASP)